MGINSFANANGYMPVAGSHDKKSKRRKSGIKRGQGIFLIVMLTVPILHWLVFWLYVNINSIFLAFQLPTGEWSFNQIQRVWIEFTSADGTLLLAMKNTLLYFANSVLIIMPLSFFLSYLYFKKIFMFRTFRVILYLPAIISSVALTAAFAAFIDPTGPLGYILGEKMGVDPVPELLANSSYATTTIIFYCTWTGVGTGILLFSGGMARIPLDVLEAAKIDGCGLFRELVQILVPLLWPTISTQLILALTGLFSASGPILLFTKGDFSTTTLGYWIFDMVYRAGNYNIVSAAGLCCTIVGVPVILGIRWLIERIPAVEY